MNLRLIADIIHLMAYAILISEILKSRSCAGISGRSHLLFLIVIISRYLNTFFYLTYFSNFFLKILSIAVSSATVHLIFCTFKETYNKKHDNFWISVLLIPAFILALLINQQYTITEIIKIYTLFDIYWPYTFLEILWTFSIYLEAIAIIPQLYMLTKNDSAETITSQFLFVLGIYKTLYLIYYFRQYYTESFFDAIPIYAGIVQILLYIDFFYFYFNTSGNPEKKNIPLHV